jgi:hypothetical protein
LALQPINFACFLARFKDGTKIATSTAMMAITTKSSIKVNPLREWPDILQNPPNEIHNPRKRPSITPSLIKHYFPGHYK